MKKNREINPLEQHFEKLVLGAVCLVLLAVVAMQFLTQPNAVRVGGSDPVPPDQVFDAVKREADNLVARMRSVDPELPEIPEQDVATRFEEVRGLAVADQIELSAIGGKVAIGVFEGQDAGAFDAATTYAMPSLPVPAAIAAQTYRATVDPFVWASNEELRSYLPAEQPFDVAAISIEGRVSGEGLRKSLEEDPDGESGALRLLPLTWWRGNIDLLGVEVQREERGPDGSWGNPTVISGMPGQPPVLKTVRRPGITPMELQRVSQQAVAAARDIAQPEFPPIIAGPEWAPPSEAVEDTGATEEDRQKRSLRNQLDKLDRQIAAREERLADAGGSEREEGGGGGGGRFGGGREGGQPSERGGQDREARDRERIQREIESLEERRKTIVDQLAALGEIVDDTARQTGSQPAEEAEPLPTILDAADMPVWVHDLSAEPGEVYRYRMRVVLNNPLFGRGQFLAEGQQDAAKSPTLEGEWSPWSEPIAMEADQHFFVVSASPDDAYGKSPRAAVEVYEFFYGYWRKASTTLLPGDTVHARANLPDTLVKYDPAKLEELAAQQQQTGRQPRIGEPGSEGGGGRRMLEQDMNERRRLEEGGERTAARGEEGEQQLPPGATKMEPWLDMTVAALLLDVARVPGSEESYQAVLRGPNGGLKVHTAEADRASALYKRLAASAREGENQGQPEPSPGEQRPNEPAERDLEREYGDPGGGGGGGGGG